MKNATVIKAQREGYQFHGATVREYDSVEMQNHFLTTVEKTKKELKQFGCKVKVLNVIETTQLRDKVSKYYYKALYVKYTPEYFAHVEAKKIATQEEVKRIEIQNFVDKLDDDMRQYLVNYLNTK